MPSPTPNPGPVAGPNIKVWLVTVRAQRHDADGRPLSKEEQTYEVRARRSWTAIMRATRFFLKSQRRRLGSRTELSYAVEAV